MEKHEKDYITQKTPELMENIVWYVTIPAILQSKGILNAADVEKLESIATNSERISEFLRILKTRKNGYALLTQAMKDVNQSGALEILEAIPPPPTPSQVPTASSNLTTGATMVSKTGGQWTLDFGEADVENEVILEVQSDLIKNMKLEVSNSKIIMELMSLKLFDKDEISTVLNGTGYRTQQQRMSELFQLISTLESEEIVRCFERLCNLKDNPTASKKFRAVFESHFEGSVRKS